VRSFFLGRRKRQNERKRSLDSVRNRFALERLEKRRLLVAGSVVINETHYNPPDKTKPVEFIELTNPGDTPFDLSGAHFTNGIDYTFPSGTVLQPGAFVVVAQSPTVFQQTYGKVAIGAFTGKLSNAGETVTLASSAGITLDEVDYGESFPWPTIGDSPGPDLSIQLINPNLDNSLGGNWRSENVSVLTNTTLFAKQTSWSYRKGTSETTPSPSYIGAWRGLDYVQGTGWLTGTGPIGYAPAGNPTMGTTLSDMNGSYTSVTMRKSFSVPNPTRVRQLTLQALYDDGFNVWINGHLALTVNTPGEDTPFNGLASSNSGSTTYVNFTISPNLLQAGDNVIAVQYFNILKSGSTDAYFDAALIAAMGTGGATPGAANVSLASNAPPAMRQVAVNPQMPTPNTPTTITAKITDAEGVASVTLAYQTVDAGNYISQQDPAYANPANWTSVTMVDNGTNGDAAAGDGVFTAVLPASVQVNRRLVRYRITATDTLGASVTGPNIDDPVQNFAYYVYAGVPDYQGALQPGAGGAAGQAQTFTGSTLGSIPMITLITKQQDHQNAMHIPGANTPGSTNSEYARSGTLVYNGVVYDNIHYRARGGVWRYAMGKNMWKIDFVNGHDFQAYEPDGTPYASKWKKLDLSSVIQQGDIGARGEQGLFETLGFQLFGLAGVPSSATIPTTLRIVENASEFGTSQYTTDFQGLYLMVEDLDGRYLDAHGLPDGNLYKMEGGTGTLQNQGPTQPTNGSDLSSFISTLSSNPGEAWLRANVDLDSFYSFQAVVEFIHHWDIGFGKNYYYYHNPDTGKWQILPWDLDLTWYVNYEPSNGNITPFYSAILSVPNLAREYKNRVRELQDLLFTPESIGKLADAYAGLVNPQGAGPTIVQADAAMWDYNPIFASAAWTNMPTPAYNANKATTGRYWLNGSPTQDFAGMVAKLKSWALGRLNYINTSVITSSEEAAAPRKPTVSYTGTTGFPLNGLAFSTSAFTAGNLGGIFKGMEWQLSDVTNLPNQNPNLEVNTVWESGVLTTFNSSVSIPSNVGLIPGHLYRIRVRMQDTNNRWGHWSDVAMNQSQFVATVANNVVKDSLRITELNFNPFNPPVGSPYDDQDFEYIELQNFGNQTINLQGVTFTQGITYTFGNVSLAPGQVGVLVHRTAAFQSRYGTGPLILGDFLSTGQAFSNGGEDIRLEDAFHQEIVKFAYSDQWYPLTDGSGPTLEVINPAVSPDLDSAANWRASSQTGGTPGTGSTAALPAPTNAAATSTTTTQVTLGWTDNATTEQGYIIFRRAVGGDFGQIASLPANTNSYIDNNGGTGLVAGAQYDYMIQAYNAAGFSNPANVAVTFLPRAPVNLIGLSGSNTFSLYWSVPVGAVSYNVYRSSTNGSGLSLYASNLPTPNFTDTNLAAGNTYFYNVTAVNSAGLESAASLQVGTVSGPSFSYQFNEGGGTITANAAGGTAAALKGAPLPTWVTPGKTGEAALSFSGNGVFNSPTQQSFVDTGANLASTLGGTASLTAWIKTTQVGNSSYSNSPAIAGVDVSGSNNDIRYGFINSTGRIGAAAGDTAVVSTSAINDGQWHHVAITRNSSTGLIQIYIDGALQVSATSETGLKSTALGAIGAQLVLSSGLVQTGATYFNGQLDDVRIYNRVISAGEVTALATSPAAPTNFSAVAQSASAAALSWVNVSTFADSIEVQRKTGPGGTYQQVALLDGNVTSYVDPGLIAQTQYFYRIRAISAAGNSAFTTELSVTPPRPTISARQIVYRGSSFDNEDDENATATDKQVLLPGQTATAANYTNYSCGINSIRIDVANLGVTLTVGDFDFRVGNTSDTNTWQVAPTPEFITTDPGGGANGSTRVTIAWTSNAIQNQWLKVTLKANALTQLAVDDTFYFGNAIGDTFNSTTDTNVNSSDLLGTRGHQEAGPVALTNVWDFNRDAVVNNTDLQIAMQNVRAYTAALQLITVPASGSGSLANEGSGAPQQAAPPASPAPATASSQGAAQLLPTASPVVSVSKPLNAKPGLTLAEALAGAVVNVASNSKATSPIKTLGSLVRPNLQSVITTLDATLAPTVTRSPSIAQSGKVTDDPELFDLLSRDIHDNWPKLL
jgi:hypothetical protein